jgi:IS5 family transposase
MKPATPDTAPQMQFLLPDLATMLDARQPLYRLAQTIDWTQFETAFAKLYHDAGRPALPIRRMVGLLLLKQLHNLSDERVVEQWTLNPYFQFFCGEREFAIRVALGESGAALQRRMVRGGGGLLLIGLAAGGLASALALQLARRQWSALPAVDGAIFALAVAVLTATVLLASWLPARRASRADPLLTLNAE